MAMNIGSIFLKRVSLPVFSKKVEESEDMSLTVKQEITMR